MSMFVKRAMLAVLPLGLSACGGGVELMSEAMFMVEGFSLNGKLLYLVLA